MKEKNASDLDLSDRIVSVVVMQGGLAGVFVGRGGGGHNLSR